MGSLFPFFGLNFVFWSMVGITRFSLEQMERMSRRELHTTALGIFNLWAVGASVAICIALFLAVMYGVGIVPFETRTPVTGDMVVRLLFLSSIFSAVGGYMVVRLERGMHVPDLLFVHILLYVASMAALVATDLHALAPFGTLFAAAALVSGFLSSYLGGVLGLTVSPRVAMWEANAEVVSMQSRIFPEEVASITPAHNEEKTIAKTVETLKRILPGEHIFIGSDASTDTTVSIARAHGAVVDDIWPNRGKANVLQHLIDQHNLLDRFKAVMIVDADSEVGPSYLTEALPLFDDPRVAAVAVHAMSKWENHWPPRRDQFFAAYRVRFYRVLQAALRYGQTWRFMNVTPIVPGFASIYRTAALRAIHINAPGLVIEDFNMTFEIHHKRLGIVAYSPMVYGVSRDPIRLKDYIKQVKRWNLGFWQTVRRHGIWPSFFWVTLGFFLLEMILFGVFSLALPFLLLWLILSPDSAATLPYLYSFSAVEITVWTVVLFFLVDYLLTVLTAFYERKPLLLLYGFGFMFLRYIDTVLFLYALPLAFFAKSDGRWISPTR